MDSRLDAITCMSTVLMAMVGVAALTNDLSHIVYYSSNPIASGKRKELEEKYGGWAVKSAIAACPLNDIECIEREARRLSEARLLRRR